MGDALFVIFLIVSAFLLLNVLLSLATTAAWRVIAKPSLNWSAKRRASFVFTLRVLPFVFSAALLLFLFIPAFALHEKENPNEFISFKLAVLACVALMCVLFAVAQLSLSLLKTRTQISRLAREENRLNFGTTKFPVYKIKHDTPMVAVFGFFKPKVFIEEKVLELLNDEEIEAVLAHEEAHITSRDNLKKLAMIFCRSLSVFRFGNEIEKAWRDSSEAFADETASREKRTRSLDLASALVKLARMMSASSQSRLTVASFISNEMSAPVAWRIQRLIKLANSFPQSEEKEYLNGFNLWLAIGISAIMFLVIVTQTDLLLMVHHLIEAFVKILV
jgi:Zn-dependent protease with chaperone function